VVIKIGFIDTETTGLDQSAGHRLIEIAVLIYTYNTDTGEHKPVGKWVKRINPDRPIDAKAQSIHKISINDLMGEPLWEDVVDEFVKVLKKVDLLVAHNMAFDGPFIVGEIARVGRQVPDMEVFCTMDKGRFATFEGFPPNLRKLCDCFDIEYDLDKAHGALYDILLTAQCFFKGLAGGYYQLPELKQLEKAA
jgi:DNA polymerase-3 subunit epsilon